MQELEFTLEQQMAVFGIQDQNIRVIEQALPVSIRARNAHIEITGESDDDVKNAADVLNHLKILYDNKEEITIDVVYRVLESVQNGEIYETLSAMSDIVVIAHSNRPIKCKTIGQKNYIKAFKKYGHTLYWTRWYRKNLSCRRPGCGRLKRWQDRANYYEPPCHRGRRGKAGIFAGGSVPKS